MFFIIEKSEETTFEFSQNAATVVWFWLRMKIETQKIVNLLGDANNESSKFAMIKITQTMIKEMKIVQPFNLNLKSLNQIFVIIQTHIFL